MPFDEVCDLIPTLFVVSTVEEMRSIGELVLGLHYFINSIETLPFTQTQSQTLKYP